MLRGCAVAALACWAASVAIVWGQHRAGVLHPAAFSFLGLFALTVGAGLVGLAAALWGVACGPRRGAADGWRLACALPLGFWAALSIDTLRLMAAGEAFPPGALADTPLGF